MNLNILNVEKLIFQNERAKKVLFDDYGNYFKEYFYLKSIGIDKSLMSNFYMKFLKAFQEKSDSYLKLIFNKAVKLNINFKLDYINFKVNLNNSLINQQLNNSLINIDLDELNSNFYTIKKKISIFDDF